MRRRAGTGSIRSGSRSGRSREAGRCSPRRSPARAPYLRAAVSYYAFLGPPQAAAADPRLSALELVRPGSGPLPPLLIARAGRDDPALNASVDAFVTAALASGVTLELMNHPAGRHGFDILDDDDRSRAMIRRTVAFLRENLSS